MSVATRTLVEIPQSILELTGFLLGGKVIQSHLENQPPKTS